VVVIAVISAACYTVAFAFPGAPLMLYLREELATLRRDVIKLNRRWDDISPAERKALGHAYILVHSPGASSEDLVEATEIIHDIADRFESYH
jgi:hypothetical protein